MLRGWPFCPCGAGDGPEGGTPRGAPFEPGVQYTSRAYVERLLGLGVRLSYAGTGKPWENGHAERLIRTIKDDKRGVGGVAGV